MATKKIAKAKGYTESKNMLSTPKGYKKNTENMPDPKKVKDYYSKKKQIRTSSKHKGRGQARKPILFLRVGADVYYGRDCKAEVDVSLSHSFSKEQM